MPSIFAEKNINKASSAIADQTTTLQGKRMPAVPVLQKKGGEEKELPVQGMFNIIQKMGPYDEEEPVAQRRSDPVQKTEGEDEAPVQGKFDPIQKKENKTGMPDNLRSGIENLSGMAMDDVKVHYNSAQPAQLNALAYAQGTDIHVAPGQEKHLPHEAWHVVQQKQGRVQATKQMKGDVPVNDDKGLETEADVMGQKAVLLKTSNTDALGFIKQPGWGDSTKNTTQLVIKKGKKNYPRTYNQILKKGMRTEANEIIKLVQDQVDDTVDKSTLILCWNNVAKGKTEYRIEKPGDLVSGIIASYKASLRSKEQFRSRSGKTQKLADPLLALDKNLVYKENARNPMVIDTDAKGVKFDSKQTNGPQRFATYTSTLTRAIWKTDEFQASVKKDGTGIMLSSNLNNINALVKEKVTMASHIKQLAENFLNEKNVGSMSRSKAMANRQIRHVLKFLVRLPQYLEEDATVSVPQNVDSKIDGMHAEIRIIREEEWNPINWEVPNGTKYPCLGCFLHFHGEKIEVGHFHGAMWVTNGALVKQLEPVLKRGKTIAKMTDDTLKTSGEKIAKSYSKLSQEHKFVYGLTRKNKSTDDYNGDSDSDLDEDTYDKVKQSLGSSTKTLPGKRKREPGNGESNEEKPIKKRKLNKN